MSLALLVTLAILTFVIGVGIVLAFTIGDSFGPTEGDEKLSNTGGKENGPEVVTGPPAVRIIVETPKVDLATPETTVPVTHPPATTTSTPGTTTTRRSGLLLCVVGESFANPDLFHSRLCDYIIYPDLVALDKEIIPIHGGTSWQAFREGATANTGTRAGMSFSTSKAPAANSTIHMVPKLPVALADIVRKFNVSALGLLGFPLLAGAYVKSAEALFKVLDDTLVQRAEYMVFLGVALQSIPLADKFISDIVTMKYVTTIILQTHVSLQFITGDGCLTTPISVQNSTHGLPSFAIAQHTLASLRSLGDKFRVMFSSTLGVMVFRGKPASSRPTAAYEECENAWMTDVDFTCTGGISSADEYYNRAELYAYGTYRVIDRTYFFTWESMQSLQGKMDLFMNSSDGWVLFEANRDVWKSCGESGNYLRIAAVHQRTRHPASP